MVRLAVLLAWLVAAQAFQPPARRLPAAAGRPLRSAADPDDEAPPPPDLKADIARFRAASGGAPPAAAAAAPTTADEDRAAADAAARRGATDAALLADVDRFRRSQAAAPAAREAGPVQTVINVLGTVLSVNFVVIVALFLWFLSGVFSLYALDNDATITAVKAAFDPFILPLLSTHMGLTFLSFGLEKTFGEGSDDDDGGFRL